MSPAIAPEAVTERATVRAPEHPRRGRRLLLWGALLALLVVAQSLLVLLTLRYESSRAQDQTEALAAQAAAEIKRDLLRSLQNLQALLWNEPSARRWRDEAAQLLRAQRELLRLERRDAQAQVDDAMDGPYRAALFEHLPRRDLEAESTTACETARRSSTPGYSRSYFVPQPGGGGQEVLDVCLPVSAGGQLRGFVVATFSLAALLEGALPAEALRQHELSFVESDGSRLARAGSRRGSAVYVAQRMVELPGLGLQLRLDSASGRPSLIPNLATALVLGLSLALFALVWLLARDVRKRGQAEAALAEALAFRRAMEDSLITGLRARDLQGRITYVNPAFCAMVGFSEDELRGQALPPYWPPEQVALYTQRQQERLASGAPPAREGHETEFMRKSGERFAVMIYEAPLVDGSGRHTGWMSAVLDISQQRRMEDLSRQQQERLQASARLATMGEMASLLSHELNQPLAAIASYASGCLNLLQEPAADSAEMLRPALQRVAEQAERAGRVIKSVHDFVRRREQPREAVAVDQLLEAVLPLVRLQSRKSGTRVEVDLAPRLPRVLCDRTMVEQVLLNLTRNAVQAMDEHTPLALRVMHLRVRLVQERWVLFTVSDAGPGISAEVASRLFTPFFTTRAEGMGLGLSLCRTVVEQHGGALDFQSPPAGQAGGTEFRFTLPAAIPPKMKAAAAALSS